MEQTTATLETVKTALTSAMTTAGSEMFAVLAAIVPIGLGIFTAIWLVRTGKITFKSVSRQ